jgi:hypothetical protein
MVFVGPPKVAEDGVRNVKAKKVHFQLFCEMIADEQSEHDKSKIQQMDRKKRQKTTLASHVSCRQFCHLTHSFRRVVFVQNTVAK